MKLLVLVLLVAVSFAKSQNIASRQSAGALNTRVVLDKAARLSTDERIGFYEHALRASPDRIELQTGLIAAYLQKLRESADFTYLDRASKLVDGILEKDGGNFVALRFENEVDLERHDFKSVADRAQHMLKYAPSDPGTWGNLGDALMELGDYEAAGAAYYKMFALRPNLASYNRLAYFRFVTGNPLQAIQLMRNAVDAEDAQPEPTAWCWAELGDMYFKTGALAEATRAYQAALSGFPRLHRAEAGLGKVAAAQGHLDLAITHYRRAQSIVPLVEYASALEDLFIASGMMNRAREQMGLIEVIEKLGRASNEKTNRNLALALADRYRDLDFALELMRAEVPVRGDVYTWDALSWVLFRKGDLEGAKAAMVKALKLGTPEPLFYYHASKIALAAGDRDAAHKYLDRVASLNPKFDISKTEIAFANVR